MDRLVSSGVHCYGFVLLSLQGIMKIVREQMLQNFRNKGLLFEDKNK